MGGIGLVLRAHVLHRQILGVAFVLALTADATAQTLTFARADVASVAGARAIVSGDFNRDGRPDLAHANIGRNTVTILLNRGADGVRRAVDVSVGAGPFDIAAGDFNRDGIADLAVANADGTRSASCSAKATARSRARTSRLRDRNRAGSRSPTSTATASRI
jgi:hypothetical protein